MHILLLKTEYGSFYKTFKTDAEMYQYLMERHFELLRLRGDEVKDIPNLRENTICFEKQEARAFIVSEIPSGAEYLAVK